VSFIDNLKFSLGLDKPNSDKHLSGSNVFCMAPWVQLHAQTNGKMAPCCMAAIHEGNEIGNLQTDSNLLNAWNSPAMKQLRLNMIDGKRNSICRNCYSYEEHGKFSERMQYNLDFKSYYQRVTDMLRDGTVTENNIPIIDIRFSNKCNYKCRICNSLFSSHWYEEELKIGTPDAGESKEMKAARDQDIFWESFKSLLPYVKRLHFAGGEPLFMDEHYEVLDHLVSIGKTDVNLTYNTNFSTLRYKKYNAIALWNKFDKVDIWASLDGMGPQGDYHRKGQKWNEVEENIRTLHNECKTAIFGVNITVSIFNILHVPDFYKYMVENRLVDHDRVNLYMLFGPEEFNITNLPQSIKDEAIKKFEELDKNYLQILPDPSKIRNHIQSVISYMQSDTNLCKLKLQETILQIDKIRNENFLQSFPDLSAIMAPVAEDSI